MSSSGVEFKGLDALIGKLKRNADLGDVKKVVRTNTSELQRRMQRAAVFTRGYSTGATQRSINQKLSDGGFTGKVAPQTEYSPYLIFGTRYMAAQDFLRPPFYAQRSLFISDMRRLMK